MSAAAGPATPTEENSSAATAKSASPGTTAPVIDPIPAVTAPSAPPASAAFRSWVQNLKISGVRAGASPRVFIERTAYGPGDLVNPQLGISFESYNAETRMLVFKDKSGALVERRN
ncbi:MAG: hypothetical protein C0518_01380 [Opitutus sp.]|nr:hypothetical protein [Opitutus sp.]